MRIVFDKDFAENRQDIETYISDVLSINVRDGDMDTMIRAFVTPGYGKQYGRPDNDRLEFLGDAVIREFVSRCLYRRSPEMDPHTMSSVGQYIWGNKVYPQYLLESGKCPLGCILLQKSEAHQPSDHMVRFLSSTTSDCFEALIGALSEIGKDDDIQRLISEILLNDIEHVIERMRKPGKDYKENLEDLAQERKLEFETCLREILAKDGFTIGSRSPCYLEGIIFQNRRLSSWLNPSRIPVS